MVPIQLSDAPGKVPEMLRREAVTAYARRLRSPNAVNANVNAPMPASEAVILRGLPYPSH